MELDLAYENFESYKKDISKYIGEDLNESETRSKLIDSLLKSVLGWKEENIKREEKLSTGYYDYFISIPGFSFIIEAKRSFDNFELPKTGAKTKIKSILKSNNEIFNQLRSYCIEKGCPYGVFMNGSQFIITKLFNTDSTDWKDNDCLVFRTIDEIDSRFVEFYNNLSYESLKETGTFDYVTTQSLIELKTISSTLIDRDKELVRNPLSSLIAPIIDRVFGDIFNEEFENDIDFIKKCFVDNDETKKNREDIHRLFEDKAPEVSHMHPIVNTENLKKSIKSKIIESKVNIRNLAPPKPIVIIGTKGSGKTSFINYLFNYETNDDLRENNIISNIDLRKFFNNKNDFDEIEISKQILTSIYQKYPELELHSFKTLMRVYHDIIKTNDEGIWMLYKQNDVNEYNKKLTEFLSTAIEDIFEHLRLLNIYLIKERRKRIIVIIDNGDQFADNVQENVYLFAHSLANRCYFGTIISLREGYYYKWRNSPPFDAYLSHVYHITAPKYSEVLNKRIKYILEKLPKDESPLSGEDSAGKRYVMSNSDVYRFLNTLNQSIFSQKQTKLIDFLSYTTHPNIREGLRVFNIFLTSGHTNISDYILKNKFKSHSKDSIHQIPIHEFIKSIALVNKLYYNSEHSIINNIFLPDNDNNDHFIKFYILLDLIKVFDLRDGGNRFVEAKGVINAFTSYGYKTKTVLLSLEKLIFFNLIDTDDHILDVDDFGQIQEKNIMITAKGYYYIKELIFKFHYLDLILQDTPIIIKESFEKIRNVFPISDNKGKRDLDLRYKTVINFVDYLYEMDKRQPPQLISKFGKVSEYILSGLNSDLERLKTKI